MNAIVLFVRTESGSTSRVYDSKLVWRKRCSVTEDLGNLREIATKFALQGPRVYCPKEAGVGYMYDAVNGNSWADSALSKAMAADEPTLQQIPADVDAAWHREQQETEERKRDGILKLSNEELSSLP